MSSSHNPPPKKASNLEDEILSFGSEIFAELDRSQHSSFSKHYISGQAMEWAMRHPEFKVNLFRLVDVLPALRSSRAIAEHVSEYLGQSAPEIHKVFSWGVSVPPSSLRAKLLGPIVRRSVREMAGLFIAGETPSQAFSAIQKARKAGFACTVDLLGEYSVSEAESLAYLNRYLEVLSVFHDRRKQADSLAPLRPNHPGELTPINLSVKLSALYSQCSPLNWKRSVDVLSERLSLIVEKAQEVDAALYIDAEDTAHNSLIYTVFRRVFTDFSEFRFPGIVLQAYLRDSSERLKELLNFSQERGSPIAVRLVKGAYWDQETIHAQQNGWPNPVFDRKEHSDARYEELSRVLLENCDLCLPAFGSHNIRSLAHACCVADELGVSKDQFELQMLFGMAEPIAKVFLSKGFLTRYYVPIGELIPGMGYLVRRLLENTSNESFLRHTFFDANQISDLLAAPSFDPEPKSTERVE